MKNEWKKNEKDIYLPKVEPQIVKVPKYNYFVIDGQGNPNGEEFSEAIGVLYSLSYHIKMLPKKIKHLMDILNTLFTLLKQYGIKQKNPKKKKH